MVDISTNTSGSINISANTNGSLNVNSNSSSNVNANTNANAQRAKSWAVGTGLIDGEDYSAKYWAGQAKISENIASNAIQGVDDAANQAIEDIETAQNEALENLEDAKDEKVAEINSTATTFATELTELVNAASSSATTAATAATEASNSAITAQNAAQSTVSTATTAITTITQAVSTATTAATQSTQNAYTAQQAASDAQSYKNDAKNYATSAGRNADTAQNAANTAQQAMTTATTAATQATQAATSANESRDAAVSAMTTATTAATTATSAADTSLSAMTTSTTAATTAVGAANDASSYASAAQSAMTTATTAATTATQAAETATSAMSTATTSATTATEAAASVMGALNNYVAKSGDTMTGDLEINKSIYLTSVAATAANSASKLYFGPKSSPYNYMAANTSGVFGIYNSSGKGIGCYPTQNLFPTNNIDLGRSNNKWKDIYASGKLYGASTNISITNLISGANAGATAIQPNDNISGLTNDAGYITGINGSDVITALGYTPYDNTNPDNFVTSTTLTSTLTDYVTTSTLTSTLTDYVETTTLATVATSGSYNDLSNKPTIPSAQVQANWNETNTNSMAYIQNKPNIPSGVVVDQVYDGTSANPQSGVAMAGELANYTKTANLPLTPYFATSTTAADTATKVVSIPAITTLNVGQIICVKPTITSTVATSKIKLNDFTAYNMRYNGANISTSTDSVVWNENWVSWFVFDGTYWQFAGHGYDNNTNTTYSAMSVSEGVTGTATNSRTVRADYLKQIIQGTKLTGLSTADNSAVVATDSILQGIGKLQAQVVTVDQTYDGTSTNPQSGVAIEGELTTNYQEKLVSSTNIKTIGDKTLLGNGNISQIDNIILKYPTIRTESTYSTFDRKIQGNMTSLQINKALETSRTDIIIDGYTIYDASTQLIPDARISSNIARTSAIPDISTKQDTLVSGTNIKTINNTSLLGSGNISLPTMDETVFRDYINAKYYWYNNSGNILWYGYTFTDTPSANNRVVVYDSRDTSQTYNASVSSATSNSITISSNTQVINGLTFNRISTLDENGYYKLVDDADTELNIKSSYLADTTLSNVSSIDANSAVQTALNTKTSLTEVLNAIYPIGSIYIGTMSTCPIATLGVGTWTLKSSGMVLQGSDSSHTAGNTISASLPQLSALSNGDHSHNRGTMDIQGELSSMGSFLKGTGTASSSGALSFTSTSNNSTGHSSSSGNSITKINLKASSNWSGSTNTTGAHTHTVEWTGHVGTTVQPNAYVVNIWERTA